MKCNIPISLASLWLTALGVAIVVGVVAPLALGEGKTSVLGVSVAVSSDVDVSSDTALLVSVSVVVDNSVVDILVFTYNK